jgi:shikimate dehydrogenase
VTRFIGLIGYPLKHSVSAHFQQAALDYYNLDMRYEAREVKADDLVSAISQLRQPKNLGANITVPYKEDALHLMDKRDDFVAVAGAVNTVINRDGRLEGFNTDGSGFLKALLEDAGFEPAQKNVVVLGAGGAARTVAFTLLDEKVSSLVIANRSLTKAENLTSALTKRATNNNMKTKIAAVTLSGREIAEAAAGCQLIVNCTTVGMKYSSSEGQSPLAPGLIPEGALVYDLVYNPLETPLLRTAKAAGASTLGGLPMLVYQGAAAFQLWTGREAPLDIMLSAAKKALAA